MEPNPTHPVDALRAQIHALLQAASPEQKPQLEQLLHSIDSEVTPWLDELAQQVSHTLAASQVLRDENARLRQRLEGHQANENAARQDAEDFRTLAENSPDVIFRLDHNLRHLYVNPAMARLSGMPREEILGRTVFELHIYDPVQVEPTVLVAPFTTGQEAQVELLLPTPFGMRWFDLRIVPEPGPGGTVDTLLHIARDITDRKRLQEEAASQRDLLEIIFSADPGGLAVISAPDGVIHKVNAAFRAVLPHPEIDPLGHSVDEVFNPAEGFISKAMLAPVFEDEASLMLEHVARAYPNGAQRTFTLHARPIQWNGQPSALLIVWETTELENALSEAHQRAAEAEESRHMLNALMNSIPEGITIISVPDEKVLYLSNYITGLGGLQRSDMEQKDFSIYASQWELYQADGITRLKPEEFPAIRAARHAEVIEDLELVIVRDGRRINILVSAAPIYDAQGRAFASVTLSRDITERKREEANQLFLNELGALLVALRQPDEVIEAIAYRLGRFMGVDRCFFSENIPGQGDRVRVDYHPGSFSLAGQYPVEAQAGAMYERLRKGKTVFVSDTAHDPLTASIYPQWFGPAGIQAVAIVPIPDWQGKWFGTLTVASSTRRVWRGDEAALLHSTADLARLAIDNSMLFKDLQEFRQRFETALRNAPLTVLTVDRDLRPTWIFNQAGEMDPSIFIGRLPTDDDLSGINKEYYELGKSVLQSGTGAHREISVTLNQRELFFDVTIEPMRGADGEISGLTLAALETTELRRAQTETILNQAQIEIQSRIITAREQERTAIARELHDGPLQDMIAASFTLVEAMSLTDKEARLAKMRTILGMLQAQIREVRRFCNELRPPTLAPFGLEKAIRSHSQALNTRYPDLLITLELDPDGSRLPEELRLTLFRVYQELINNVVRHSKATEVTISLRIDDDHILLQVDDNGIGFPTPSNWVDLARQGHLGLVGLKERIQMAGGEVEIESGAECGSSIRVSVPL